MNNICKRIIIFRPGALGDTLIAAPLIRVLKNKYPEATIEYISEKHRKSSVVNGTEAISLITGVSKAHLYDPLSNSLNRLQEIKLKTAPAKEDILLYLCYQRSSALAVIRDFVFFKLVGFKRLVGFKSSLHDALFGKINKNNESEYERLFRMSSCLVEEKSDCIDECLLNADKEWGDLYWQKNNLDNNMVIAVCPGSKMQSKRWPAERYAELISKLGKDENLTFIIIGDENDKGIADFICSNTEARVISAIGTTLLQTSTILSRAKLYIGNDTGPMHMAALNGIPCVAVFSSTNRKGKWHPWGNGHIILRQDLTCSGCLQENCHSDPPECLTAISTDTVVEAVKKIFKRR